MEKKPLNCEKKPPHTEKNVAKLPPHGEKGSKKAFSDEKSPPPTPCGDKRSNKAPFLFLDLYTTANAIYQLDIRFGFPPLLWTRACPPTLPFCLYSVSIPPYFHK